MTHKFPTRLKVTDGERYDRFVAMTQRIGVLDDLKNFEKAFQKAFKDAFENAPAGHRTNGAGLHGAWARRGVRANAILAPLFGHLP
jgi:hypothetical protein